MLSSSFFFSESRLPFQRILRAQACCIWIGNNGILHFHVKMTVATLRGGWVEWITIMWSANQMQSNHTHTHKIQCRAFRFLANINVLANKKLS